MAGEKVSKSGKSEFYDIIKLKIKKTVIPSFFSTSRFIGLGDWKREIKYLSYIIVGVNVVLVIRFFVFNNSKHNMDQFISNIIDNQRVIFVFL